MVTSLFFVYDNTWLLWVKQEALGKMLRWKGGERALNADKELIQNSLLPGF